MTTIKFSHEHGDDYLTYTISEGYEAKIYPNENYPFMTIDGTDIYQHEPISRLSHIKIGNEFISFATIIDMAAEAYDDILAESAREESEESYSDMVRSFWVGKE